MHIKKLHTNLLREAGFFALFLEDEDKTHKAGAFTLYIIYGTAFDNRRLFFTFSLPLFGSLDRIPQWIGLEWDAGIRIDA